ncbi:MAG: carbohydrate binding domain-containing protein [Spirochaetota bacterium]
MERIIIAALAAASSLFSVQNLVLNPGAEEGIEKPTAWNIGENVWAEDAHSGKRSLVLKGKPGDKWNVVTSSMFTLKPATVYTLTFWAKADGGGVMQGGLREIDEAGKTITYTWQKTRNNAGWGEYTLVVKTRTNAAAGQIYFQGMEDFSGQAWSDDVSLTEGGDIEGARRRTAARMPDTNLLDNPGFEQGNNGWRLPPEGKIAASGGIDGSACLVIDNPDYKKRSPFAGFTVNDIPANREYVFSARVKSMAVGEQSPKLKIELYNDKGDMTGGLYSMPMNAAGVWQRVSVKMRASRDVARAMLLLRMFGSGEAVFDDLDFRFTEPVPYDIEVYPRVVYAGAELKTRILFQINADDVSRFKGSSIEIKVIDEDTGMTVAAPAAVPVDKAAIPVTIRLSSDKVARYQIKTRMVDASGAVAHAANDTAIVVERPSMVKQGYYVVNGKPFFPIGGYHVNHDKEYPTLAAAGFNAVQGSGTHELSVLKAHLDRCTANGLYYCLPLYGGMKVRENFSNTRAKLAAFAEHPSLLGFWSMDEPDVWGVGPADLVELRAILQAGTRVHPASSVIFPPSKHFMEQQESMDVVYVDPYPKKKNPEPITAVRDWVDGAKRAGKPIVCVVQAFDMPPNWVKPTPADLENYIYQSLIHGAVGIFYYSVNDPGWNLIKSDLWEKTKQMNSEMNTLAPVLLSDAMRHATWNVKSNPDVDFAIAVVDAVTYALAVNVSEKEAAVSIPLPAGAKGAVSALFGRGKPVLKEGRIVDTIEPLGTRAYIIK